MDASATSHRSRALAATPDRRRLCAGLLAALLATGPAAAAGSQAGKDGAPAFVPAIPTEPATATTIDAGVIYRELTRGVYEAAYSAHDDSLYVASALLVPGVSGGVIYRLDPDTLQPVGAIHTDLRNFALALSPDGRRLYATNSLEHGVTAIDLEKKTVLGRVRFEDADAKGNRFGPRQILHDAARGVLYVGAVGDPGVVWVLDAETLALRHTIRDAGKWITGLLLHPRTGDLYVANGGGEILRIDTARLEIADRFKPAGKTEALLLNMAFDPERNRLYVTDHSKLKTTLVVDPDSGRKLGEIPGMGDSMAILFNGARRELYISHREQGTVSVVDADSYAVKRTVRAAPNPNSLALSADGRALYVTVKMPFTSEHSTGGTESVVRIPLE